MKFRVFLKFEVFYLPLESLKFHFPRRTCGVPKGVVNFMGSEMNVPAKFVPENSFLKNGVGLKLRGVLIRSNAIYVRIYIYIYIYIYSGFGGLGVACWPLVP